MNRSKVARAFFITVGICTIMFLAYYFRVIEGYDLMPTYIVVMFGWLIMLMVLNRTFPRTKNTPNDTPKFTG